MEKTISAYSEKPLYIPYPDVSYESESKTESVAKREISLDINGKGSMNVKSNMNKEQIVAVLYDYMKPVLMDIVEQDVFEEGEGSYDF